MSDDSVFPEPSIGQIVPTDLLPDSEKPSRGLTKRELFAALAMQGVLANSQRRPDATNAEISVVSVAIADALLAELAKDGAK